MAIHWNVMISSHCCLCWYQKDTYFDFILRVKGILTWHLLLFLFLFVRLNPYISFIFPYFHYFIDQLSIENQLFVKGHTILCYRSIFLIVLPSTIHTLFSKWILKYYSIKFHKKNEPHLHRTPKQIIATLTVKIRLKFIV